MAYRIFISHTWRTQDEYYWGLLRLLRQARYFNFNDLSVPKIRPFEGDYPAAKDDIFRVLTRADVVLVVNTAAVSRSAAVQDELNEAERLGIPIIAVSPPRRHGSRNRSNLAPIQRATPANWTTKSIVDAIRSALRTRPGRPESVVLSEEQYQSVAELTEAEIRTPAEFAEEPAQAEEPTGMSALGSLAGSNQATELPKAVVGKAMDRRSTPRPEGTGLPKKKSWIARFLGL